MKCPRDGTILSKVSLLGVELDKCHRCDGIWFDRGELDRIRDSGVTDAEEVLEKRYGNPKAVAEKVEGHMRCPRCDGRLQRFSYSYIEAVSVDRCEKCLGLWLDDGELNAIAGQKKKMDKELDPGRLKSFLRSIGRLFGKE